MVILQITTEKKDTVLLQTDEGVFRLNKDVCAAERLRPGLEISPEDWQRIRAESDKKGAFLKGLEFVSRRRRSGKELFCHLNQKGFGGEAIESAVEKLSGYGYLDDREYARSYMASAAGKGRLKTRFELEKKGISPDIIEEFSKSPERELKECMAEAKKYLKGKDPSDIKVKQSLYRRLAYRGFDAETISKTFGSVLGEGFEEL